MASTPPCSATSEILRPLRLMNDIDISQKLENYLPRYTAGVCALCLSPSGISPAPPLSAPGELLPTGTWRSTIFSQNTPPTQRPPAPSHATSLAGSIPPLQNAALTAPRASRHPTPIIPPHLPLKDMPKNMLPSSRGSYANQKRSHPIPHIDPAKKNCWRRRMDGGNV